MKTKKRLLWSASLLLLILGVLFLLYYDSKKQYILTLDKIETRKCLSVFSVNYWIDICYEQSGAYFVSHNELRSLLRETLGADSTTHTGFYLADYFSTEGKELRYIPILNRQNQIVGYMLLSVGVDGKEDVFVDRESVFIDELCQLTNVYNRSAGINNKIGDTYLNEKSVPFSIVDQLLGDMDYLVAIKINEGSNVDIN